MTATFLALSARESSNAFSFVKSSGYFFAIASLIKKSAILGFLGSKDPCRYVPITFLYLAPSVLSSPLLPAPNFTNPSGKVSPSKVVLPL